MDNEKGVAEAKNDWYVAMTVAGLVAEGLGMEEALWTQRDCLAVAKVVKNIVDYSDNGALGSRGAESIGNCPFLLSTHSAPDSDRFRALPNPRC